MITYGIQAIFDGTFEEAEEAVRVALKEHGFGVLTEIDVRATLKKKLNVEHPEYKILGACNPPLALKALTAEPEIGLLLPCNVIVYQKDSQVIVSAMKPTAVLGVTDNHNIGTIAKEVESQLQLVISSLED